MIRLAIAEEHKLVRWALGEALARWGVVPTRGKGMLH